MSTRWVVFAGICAIISLTALSLTLIIRLLPEQYETALGDYPEPAVLNRVPGIEGPAAHLGEVLVLRGDRCVNRATQTITTTLWTWQGEPPAPSGNTADSIKAPASKGCMSGTLTLKMPESIMPGTWAITGIVRDVPSGDVRYWTSEHFQVVP